MHHDLNAPHIDPRAASSSYLLLAQGFLEAGRSRSIETHSKATVDAVHNAHWLTLGSLESTWHYTVDVLMPVYDAFYHPFGLKDTVGYSKSTLGGEGLDSRTFETAGVDAYRRIRYTSRIAIHLGSSATDWEPTSTRRT
ncbi:hypothetical protein FA15DRAFT_297145 [Coprinopsis marcescibilis]|uniref:Uncharacterized protein n=1 Tax=Coprinopsis marcescibilis TaxID=230819 RepID=A0A5C3KE10_COPMA|nr:hypothetical protein FA15DRAFT_297145 [Coprinopsis marcescibilis]